MRVAIVGGGLSGTVACLQLLRTFGTEVRITLIERRSHQLNRGVAYSAELSQQLLNVPAARMGIFPDAVEEFHTWSSQLGGTAPNAFLSRRHFGDFVQDRFRSAVQSHPEQVEVLDAEAVGMERVRPSGWRVRLRDGRAVEADKVLLALGSAPPAHVPTMSGAAQGHAGYVAWPWRPGVLGAIHPEREVVFVGSGLTMVDLVLSLVDQGHRGRIIVVSRRGFLPRPHAHGAPHVFIRPLPQVEQTPVSDLLAWVRAEIRDAQQQGGTWQSVIDAVRPHVQDWWQRMPLLAKKAFLRHLRPFWEVHRHRMPADVEARLTALRNTGQLRLLAGHMQGVEVDGQGGLQVRVRPRGCTSVETFEVGHLINCTGPQADSRRIEQPLLVDLLAKELVAWDELHMGLRSTPVGAVVDGAGQVSDDLYLLGPMCKATLWECTAVPEIRLQVQAVVRELAAQAR